LCYVEHCDTTGTQVADRLTKRKRERDGGERGRAGSPRRVAPHEDDEVGWPAGHWVGVDEWVDGNESERDKTAKEGD